MDFSVDYSDRRSLHNWFTQLNLVCEDDKTIGLVGSLGFLGWALTAIIVTPLADKYGRKMWIITSIIAGTLLYGGLYSVHSLEWMMLVMFLLGVTIPGRMGVAFVYASEFLTPS